MGAEGVRSGRKKGQPVIKFKVQTCWPSSPFVWRTVVEWEASREAKRSVEALLSMRYRVRVSARFIDGVSYSPGRNGDVLTIMGEFPLVEFDKMGSLTYLRYNGLCQFLPEWVYGGVDKEELVEHA